MALATIQTIGRLGIRCFPITVEVDVSPGLPSFSVVGLPDTILQESKERIRSAIKNTGATFPLSRITVNLAPSDIKKEGVGFDLPIALGILVASEQVAQPPNNAFFYGELGLQGELKPTRGTLSFVISAHAADRVLYVPAPNADEAGLVPQAGTIYAVSSLLELIRFFKQEEMLKSLTETEMLNEATSVAHDFADIVGQAMPKRALEIAAAGHHNILLRGSPGSGKTLLSRAMPGIMPPLTREEMLEATQLWSVAGLLSAEQPMVRIRPFRSPHHSASLVAMVGGGTPPRPGEISLAHQGVLFLDEFAEFPRSVIEALRQPLEDRVITVARAGATVVYPAHCLLVAAINPCPCGFRDDPKRACVCSPVQIIQYQKKLSGPILDRIDLHVIVPPVAVESLATKSKAESSQKVRDRVIRARQKQAERYKNMDWTVNSQLSSRDVEEYCRVEPEARETLLKAVDTLNLSARAYHKVVKVARTIGDLDGAETVTQPAIAEALRYRPVE